MQKEDNNDCISFRDARSTAGDFLDLKIGLEPFVSTMFSNFFTGTGVRGPLNVLNDCKLIINEQGGQSIGLIQNQITGRELLFGSTEHTTGSSKAMIS